jgi:hypothetical protein
MGILDDIGDFFGLGGSDASSAYAYEVKSTLAGGVTTTIQGGEKPVVVDVGLDDVNVELGGGDRPLRSELVLSVPEPIRTSSSLESDSRITSNLAVTEPIVSEIASRLDVEPVVVDLCVDVGLSKLPRASIHQPYGSRVGFVVLGTEWFGVDWSGESNVIMDDLPDRGPTVVGLPHEPAPHPSHGNPRARPTRSAARAGDGLRIRIG